MNNRGHIVGFFYGDTPETAEPRGFVKKGRKFKAVDAPFPGTYNTSVNGINNAGDMVGTFSSTELGFGSFVRVKGQFIELVFPSALVQSPSPSITEGKLQVSFPTPKEHTASLRRLLKTASEKRLLSARNQNSRPACKVVVERRRPGA